MQKKDGGMLNYWSEMEKK